MLKKFTLDEDVKQINLFDERWYELTVDEKIVYLTSVTTYLEAWPKGFGYELWLQTCKDPAAVRNEAGQIGTDVHGMIQKTLMLETITYDKNMKIEVWERYLSWCSFWKDFSKKHTVETDQMFIEKIVYSLKYLTAGTVDLLALVDGVWTIIDWKTGKNVGDTAEIQVSTYAVLASLLHGITVENCLIVQINPGVNKAGFRVHEINGIEAIKDNFMDFLHAQKIWLRANKNPKPKYKTYPTEVNLEFIKNNEIIITRPEAEKKEPKVKKEVKGVKNEAA